MTPAAARVGAPTCESRSAALAASALLAAAVHAWLLFGVRIHLHEAPQRAETLELTLVAPAQGVPIAAPAPAPASAPAPLPPRVEPRPRRPAPRPAEVRPGNAHPAPEALPEPAGESAPIPAPEGGAPGARVGPEGGAAASRATGLVSARPRYRRNPEPEYPASARRRRQEGVVVLEVRVAASGRPEAVEVRASSGFAALDASAVAAVSEWEFEPGRIDGEPVPSQVEIPIHFQLDRD